MDYLKIGKKEFIIISNSDCIDMAYLGYESFDLIFTEEDWLHISELPNDGICFFHFFAKAHKFIKLATNKSHSYNKRFKKLRKLHYKFERKMLEKEYSFPVDWKHDVL